MMIITRDNNLGRVRQSGQQVRTKRCMINWDVEPADLQWSVPHKPIVYAS